MATPILPGTPGPSTPSATYSLPYTNTSTKKLDLELEVVSAMVPRFSRSNTAKWDRFDVRNYTLELAPETCVVSGQLQWFGDANWMPRLLYPPETQTLFSGYFVGTTVNQASLAERAPGFVQPPGPATASDLSVLVKRVANQSPGCFRELQATTIADDLT